MSRDLRKFARQTNMRLALGGAFLILVVGVGLIWWVYGPAAASMGLICILGGLLLILIVFGILQIMDWVVKHANRE